MKLYLGIGLLRFCAANLQTSAILTSSSHFEDGLIFGCGELTQWATSGLRGEGKAESTMVWTGSNR